MVFFDRDQDCHERKRQDANDEVEQETLGIHSNFGDQKDSHQVGISTGDDRAEGAVY